MQVELDVSLDPTLGCGQAHRWKKDGNVWKGVIGHDIISLTQTENGFICEGCSDRQRILDYFRAEDDLDMIISKISEADPYVAGLSAACPGMRILRQDRWECLATYLLATNVNIKRIAKMVDSVCSTFGKDLGGMHAFPTPKEILDKCDEVGGCKLGFREGRFIELAERVENGEIDPDAIAESDYGGCVTSLIDIKGVGPKVADCVALFAYGHMNAFPVDARIATCLENIYGVTGNYKKMAEFGRNKFGEYAGYAQEFLYHSNFIL
jgi:N-glycosylase/DNA lyase